ncbi:MAG: aminotransferase class I/II-fold pyridoxal phosphate-dependent enzyme, partial [Pseudomonadales bacterium]
AALKSMDNWGNVIYTGSLSKSLLPGLRIGYMVGDRHFIREAKALRHHIIRHPPVNNQRSVALFMQRGYFDRFLTKLTGEYKLRSHVMSEALNRHLPGSAIPPAFGGGSFWVELPQDIDALALQRACKRRSVWFEPAGSMFSDPVANKNHLRLGYSSIDQSLIEPGVAIIAEEVRRQRG